MKIITGRNVNTLFPLGVSHLDECGVSENTRAGLAVVAPTPVCSVYQNPRERVLFSRARNANPFLHLHEALWMLAGRDDATSLDRYVPDFGARFAEIDGTIHGAYGRRWRGALGGYDQLDEVVKKLRANPTDRQAVVQMWDVTAGDLVKNVKDRPCNTHAYLRVRDVAYADPPVTDQNSAEHEARIARGGNLVLDLTVLCRSNDVVWGAYGANAVHFSVLHEYLAGRIGVRVGKMYQFSNNFHGYVDVLDKIGEPHLLFEEQDPYECSEVFPRALGEDWGHWDEDVRRYMLWHDEELWEKPSDSDDIDPPDVFYNMDFFVGTAGVMAACNWLWKHGRCVEALDHARRVEASDWRLAAQMWMQWRLGEGSNK